MGCSCCGHKYIPPASVGAVTPPRQGVIIVGARRHISFPKPVSPAPTVSPSTPTSEKK